MTKTTYTHLPILLTLIAATMAMSASATPYYIYKALSDTVEVYDDLIADDEIGESATLQTDEFPVRYRDRDQNRREDGTESATVARYNRGSYFLVEDSLFQHRAVSKFYPNKRFLDKAMFDLSGGILWGHARDLVGRYSMGVGYEGRISIADWVTPEHGWRLGLNVGVVPLTSWGWTPSRKHTYDPLQYGVRADYMLNMTAVSRRSYPAARRLEFYGIAGLDFGVMEYRTLQNEHAVAPNMGGHIGLRGVYNFGSNYFAYLEPEVRVYRPSNLLDRQEGDQYAVGLGLTAGIGIRKNPYQLPAHQEVDSISAIGNDWFVQAAGGVAVPLDRFEALGPRINISVGKWINCTSGFRVSLNSATHRLYAGQPRTAALGIEGDFMWNLSRALSARPTYERTRESRFGVIYFLGMGYNVTDRMRSLRRKGISVGTGFQFNYRLARMSYFYLEPRIDYYHKNYFAGFPSEDIDKPNNVMSLLAGFSFHQGMHTQQLRERNEAFELTSWYDRLFIQGAAGVQVPVTTYFIRAQHRAKILRPKAFIAVGKWFTATHGVRILAEGGSLKQRESVPMQYQGFAGAEYMWNISNALAGYRSDRPFEFIAGIGTGVAWRTAQPKKVHPAFAADLQAHYNVTPQWSLYVEPQLRLFARDYMPYAGTRADAITSLMIGTQLRTPGCYVPSLAREASEGERRGFYGIAGGFNFPMRRTQTPYGYAGRFSMGHWVTPASAYRISLIVQGYPKDFATRQQRHIRAMLGADYLFDMLHLAYGYDGKRLFSLRPLLGGNAGIGFRKGKDNALEGDVHVGVQGAFRVAPHLEVYLEPQMMYSFYEGGMHRDHVTPTFYLGVNRTIESVSAVAHQVRSRVRDIRDRNAEDFTWSDDNKAFNRMFFEFGAGPQLLWSRAAKADLRHYMGFGGYMAFGRWFTAQNGLRLNLNGGRVSRPGHGGPIHTETLGFGIEYAQSISNAIWKHNPDRLFDVNGYVGPYFQYFRNVSKLKMGLNFALQPVLNINRTYSLFLQHDFTFYRKLALYPTSFGFHVTNNVMLGLQVHPENYDRAESRRLFDESDKHAFFSVAGGPTAPFRHLNTYDKPWGGAGRLSYGRWFLPASAWRINLEGRGYSQSNHDRRQCTEVLLGADYLLDVTTLAKGYSEDGRFILRALIGANAGTYYQAKGNGRLNFLADVHTGGQMGVLAGRSTEIYVEPTVRYNWAGRIQGSRLSNAFPQVMLGVSQRLVSKAKEGIKDEKGEPVKQNFATVGLGTGCHTYTLISVQSRRKFIGSGDVSYGRWFNRLSALRAGVSNNYFRTSADMNCKDYTDEVSIHADYMLNLLSLFSGADARSKRAEFAAYAGLTYTLAFATGEDMHKGLGGEAGLQVGYKITPSIGLFLEPAVTIHGSRLSEGVRHGLDGNGRVLLGVKYAF